MNYKPRRKKKNITCKIHRFTNQPQLNEPEEKKKNKHEERKTQSNADRINPEDREKERELIPALNPQNSVQKKKPPNFNTLGKSNNPRTQSKAIALPLRRFCDNKQSRSQISNST